MNPQNPLYLHGSDGPNTVTVEKLVGISNYRRWRRSMEIALSSKGKLGFVNGTVVKDESDKVKGELWDTCNDTVIGWIMGSVQDSIKQAIMYMLSASELWLHLERRYALTNGSLKYKLNRDLYNLKQNGSTIAEYYRTMRGKWVELESLDQLPLITIDGDDIKKFLEALNQQKEEKRLFQFLNGLDECYGPQRSHLLMMSTLPTVEVACSSLQQEEYQRNVLLVEQQPLETVIGYPKWHPKHKGGYKEEGERPVTLPASVTAILNPTTWGGTGGSYPIELLLMFKVILKDLIQLASPFINLNIC